MAHLHALSGQVYPLIGAATRIGRLADNDVYVQGRRIRGSVAVAEGDRIRIGRHEFVFEIEPRD